MERSGASSLANKILDVFNFASKILSSKYHTTESGWTLDNADLEATIRDLRILGLRVKSWTSPVSGASSQSDEIGPTLKILSAECEEVGEELQSILTALQEEGSLKRYENLPRAIESKWGSEKYNHTQQRLARVRDETGRYGVLATKQAAARSSILDPTQRTMEQRLEARYPIILSSDVPNRIQAQLYSPDLDGRCVDMEGPQLISIDWAYHTDNPKGSGCEHLYDWLRDGSGIFWINGKNGSGRSTLMKYLIHRDSELQDFIITKFFFCRTHSELLKSQEGLFRSLLYQVLDHERYLSQLILSQQYTIFQERIEAPTFEQVKQAFKYLSTLPRISEKILIIVGGLDEFSSVDTTTAELAKFFMEITDSHNIKALLSTQPLLGFRSAFQKYPMLRVEQLTHDEIIKFIHGQFAENSKTTALTLIDPAGVHKIVSEIAQISSGVFTWIKIAVNSLLYALQDCDGISDLQERVQELPRDVDDLLHHVLQRMDTKSVVDSSKLFQIMRSHKDLTAVQLRFTEIEEAKVISEDFSVATEAQIEEIEQEVQCRLKSICAGLVELRMERVGKQNSPLRRIDYVHPDVALFLHQEPIWTTIKAHTSAENFDPNMALLRSIVMQVKRTPNLDIYALFDLGYQGLEFAGLAECSTQKAFPTLLDELDRALKIRQSCLTESNINAHPWYDDPSRTRPLHDDFLSVAVKAGLVLYTEHELKKHGHKVIERNGRPLLEYACIVDPAERQRWSWVKPEMVNLLLQHGADPDQIWGRDGKSVWQNILTADRRDPLKWTEILRLLVMHGADPNTSIEMKEVECDEFITIKTLRITVLGFLQTKIWSHPDLEARLDQYDRQLWYSIPEQHKSEGGPISFITQETLVTLNENIESLRNLLIERGAKAREWHKTVDGSFEEFFDQDYYPRQSRPRNHGEETTTKRKRFQWLRKRAP